MTNGRNEGGLVSWVERAGLKGNGEPYDERLKPDGGAMSVKRLDGREAEVEVVRGERSGEMRSRRESRRGQGDVGVMIGRHDQGG
jgi:hypothetical protein